MPLLTNEEIEDILKALRKNALYEVRFLFGADEELTDEQAIRVIKNLIHKEIIYGVRYSDLYSETVVEYVVRRL